jgi:hypothetical protein
MNRKRPVPSSAINAAALQDHLLKQFSLSTSQPKRSSSFSRNAKAILKLSETDEITKKQIQYNNKLSLAQRLGLVTKPDAPLNHEQWAQVEKQSEIREEYKGRCPICQEHLGREATVILSCSHVFHKNCISSFEKYSKTKACPICRKKSYEKKAYKTSQDYYYMYCVVKIQSWIKMINARERFVKHMLSHPSVNQRLNRNYAEIQMRRLNYRLNKHLSQKESQIDKLFEDLERKLMDSQAAVSALKNANRSRQAEFRQVDWNDVKNKAMIRDDKACPICLQGFERNRENCVLSCSHVFHLKCIESFEQFSIKTPCCPVCRNEYVRTVS